MQATSTPDLLEAALEAVQEALRHPASTIFRKPVDHVGLKLTDYTTVIPNPCDLGTICKQLEAGRKSNWRRSSYSSVDEVLADCLRVFENCEVYNRNDPGTRQLADDARQVFLSAWQVAGLPGPKPRKSAAKPASNGKQDSPAVAKKEKAGARRSNAAADSPANPAAEPEPEQAPIDPASCKPEAEVPARFSIQSGKIVVLYIKTSKHCQQQAGCMCVAKQVLFPGCNKRLDISMTHRRRRASITATGQFQPQWWQAWQPADGTGGTGWPRRHLPHPAWHAAAAHRSLGKAKR